MSDTNIEMNFPLLTELVDDIRKHQTTSTATMTAHLKSMRLYIQQASAYMSQGCSFADQEVDTISTRHQQFVDGYGDLAKLLERMIADAENVHSRLRRNQMQPE